MDIKIISSKDIITSIKLKGGYHLSKGLVWDKIIRSKKYMELGDLVLNISNIGLNKRIYAYRENGVPLVSNSDLSGDNPLERCKYVSKKYCYNSERAIKSGMILFTGIGNVGEVFYACKELEGAVTPIGNVIRITTNHNTFSGYIYAFFKSKIGRELIKQLSTGSVQSYIDPTTLKSIPVLFLDKHIQEKINTNIIKATELRSYANSIINTARERVLIEAGLDELNYNDYEFYASHSITRKVTTFTVNNISQITLNAFNYSKRIEKIRERVINNGAVFLRDILNEERGCFSSSQYKRLVLTSGKTVKLIGQRDLFTKYKEGKNIAKMFVPQNESVKYGEVLIAGVGTMGESETFCRCEFAGKQLEGQCVAGEFIRLNTKSNWHPGYLYAWLSTDYGFRMLRSIESGTKLCRPIPKLLMNIPVPELNIDLRNEIGLQVEKAYELRYEALQLENEAVFMIEKEI